MDITPSAPVTFFGLPLEGYNALTLFNTWLVTGLLMLFGWMAVRSRKVLPGRFQAMCELLAGFFDDICTNTLGEEHGRKFAPFIGTLFLFVFLSNAIGIIPNLLAWLGWPGFQCPTQDLNTPLGLALIVVFVVHISGIRARGFREWLWSFFDPSFPATGTAGRIVATVVLVIAAVVNFFVIDRYVGAFPAMSPGQRMLEAVGICALLAVSITLLTTGLKKRRVPNLLMAPLNVVGEIGKAISHPFRLFGNIFGGFVILVVISELVHVIGVPPLAPLNAFFGLFIGLVQAFVFAMLALAYAAVQIKD
jgi:F0F1-type ATP synthase membrane subunit a